MEKIYFFKGMAKVIPPKEARYFAGGLEWDDRIFFFDKDRNFIEGWKVHLNGAGCELVKLIEPDPGIYWDRGFLLLPGGRCFPPTGGRL